MRRVVRRIEADDPAFAFGLSFGGIAYLERHQAGHLAYLIAVEGSYRPGADHVVLLYVAAKQVP